MFCHPVVREDFIAEAGVGVKGKNVRKSSKIAAKIAADFKDF